MNKKPSALSVLAKMADLDLKEFVFAFPLNTNFKYARTGREGWGEVTIAVTNHIITNIDKFSGSLYMADKDAYADIEKTLEQEGAAFDEMKVRAEAAEARAERLEDALQQIDNWAKAYPLDVFPEPDFRRVREALEAAGITLDSVSASNMRHVITGIARIVEKALKGGEE